MSIQSADFPRFSAEFASLKQFPFSRNDLLPMQPGALWRLESGVVRSVTWSEEGTVVTLGYWATGDVLGQPLTRIQPYQLECLTGVEATLIPAHSWHLVLDAIMAHAQQSEELLDIVRCERVYRRLSQLLLWLARKFGRAVPAGQAIDLRLTHQEIAELIGSTRVTVTRLLKDLEAEGKILRRQRHSIVLCDLDAWTE